MLQMDLPVAVPGKQVSTRPFVQTAYLPRVTYNFKWRSRRHDLFESRKIEIGQEIRWSNSAVESPQTDQTTSLDS